MCVCNIYIKNHTLICHSFVYSITFIVYKFTIYHEPHVHINC